MIYDGVDLSVNARLPGGVLFAGGTNTERTKIDTCYALDDPSLTPIVPASGSNNPSSLPPARRERKGTATFGRPS